MQYAVDSSHCFHVYMALNCFVLLSVKHLYIIGCMLFVRNGASRRQLWGRRLEMRNWNMTKN